MSAVQSTRPGEGVPPRIVVPLRLGVDFPNWEAVETPRAEEALRALLRVMPIQTQFADYTAEEDRLQQAVLELYRELGRAPGIDALAEATGLAREEIGARLRRLEKRDLVVLDSSSGELAGAYPFTERDTGHRVRLGTQMLNAMCAIDALGAGAMYRADTVVESICRHCAAPIRVKTRAAGEVIRTVSPPKTVVWAGAYYEGCAADSLCTVLTFFCGDAHLDAWRTENPDVEGYRLSLDEALQVGKAIFTPFLTPSREAGVR